MERGSDLMKRAMVASVLLALWMASVVGAGALTLDNPELAGISGPRSFWDRPVVLAADGLTEDSGRGSILHAKRAVWAPELRWHNGLDYWFVDRRATRFGACPT